MIRIGDKYVEMEIETDNGWEDSGIVQAGIGVRFRYDESQDWIYGVAFSDISADGQVSILTKGVLSDGRKIPQDIRK